MKGNFKLKIMKNTIKTVLAVVSFAFVLASCSPKSDKPVSDQDSVKNDAIQATPDSLASDSTAQAKPDSAAAH